VSQEIINVPVHFLPLPLVPRQALFQPATRTAGVNISTRWKIERSQLANLQLRRLGQFDP
jgi:hypothetical protein